MKKLSLTATITLFFVLNLLGQDTQLPNTGFETWSTYHLYDEEKHEPVDWSSSNTEDPENTSLISETTDAYHGESAARIDVSEDSTSGYLFLGTLNQGYVQDGIEYTDTFDRIYFHYKGELHEGDTLRMLITRFNNDTVTYQESITATGNSSGTFTSMSVSVDSLEQEKLSIAFLLNNTAGNLDPNTHVIIDQVYLENSQKNEFLEALPNYSFELWETMDYAYQEPDGWSTDNEIVLRNADQVLVTPSEDAYNGDYAAQAQTGQFGTSPLPAFLSVGAFNAYDNNLPREPIPYNYTPAYLEGYYKYSPVEDDTATIGAFFYKDGNLIGEDYIDIGEETNVYTNFYVDINLSDTPDEMMIMVFSGNIAGSTLLVDEVKLTDEITSIATTGTDSGFNIFPNPATNQVNIEQSGDSQPERILVKDISGQLIARYDGPQQQLDVSEYQPGQYLIIIETKQSQSVQKIMVN